MSTLQASDEFLIKAVRPQFEARGVAAEERRMFGGVCCMVDHRLCVGVTGDRLMLRVDAEGPDDRRVSVRLAPGHAFHED